MKHYILALLSALALGACSSSDLIDPTLGASGAVLTVVFPSRPSDTLDVFITDSATIAAAEAFVSTNEGSHMLSGRIRKGAGWDAGYPFHYIPESVRLVDVAMEICDGAPMKTARDVDDFFGWSTGDADSESAPWCPWESKPVKVQRIAPAS